MSTDKLTEQEIRDINGRIVAKGDFIRVYQQYYEVVEDENMLKAVAFDKSYTLYLVNWKDSFEIIGCNITAPAKEGVEIIEVKNLDEPGRFQLTNQRGDTYTSKSEELRDFLFHTKYFTPTPVPVEGIIKYLKCEYDLQIVKMKRLGINVEEQFFEQCVNTLIAMAEGEITIKPAPVEQEGDKPEWQLCPKCNGQGCVSKSPWLAGDVYEWSSSELSHTCDVCNGAKIIARPTT